VQATRDDVQRDVPSPVGPRVRRGPDRWQLASIALVALALWSYLWRLGTADRLADEVVYSSAGRAYLDGDFTANPEHPLLAKLLIGVAESLFGSPTGGRLVGALSGLTITLLLHVLARRVAGPRWGLAAALTWVLLPHALPDEPDRFGVPMLDRFGTLDPVTAALALLALVLGWRWAEEPSVRLAVLTGAAVGLATSAKLTGVLVAPAIAGLVLLCSTRGRQTAVQAGAATGAALVAYAAPYLAAGGQAPALLRSAVTAQLDHAATGHRVVLAGTVYDRAPWWTHLHFAWRDDGPVVTVLLALLVAAALAWSSERRLVGYLAAAVVVPLVVLSASPVALPHYRLLWHAPLVLLAVLGLRALLDRGSPGRLAAPSPRLVLLGVGCAARGRGRPDGPGRLRRGGLRRARTRRP
jgi:4-amino-4-deoxy-L-arabinose transferase-like glycosyltransferase